MWRPHRSYPHSHRHHSAAESGVPYRSGGHTNAAAIAEFGGESNYVDGPRRRRSPPVSLSAPFSSSQPSQHLLPPALRHLLRSMLFIACVPHPPYPTPLLPHSRIVVQDGSHPSRSLYDSVGLASKTWPAVAERGAGPTAAARIACARRFVITHSLARGSLAVAQPTPQALLSAR